MWNYLVAGLAVGCTLVLFDGSPLFDPSMLWKMAEDLKVTVFGTVSHNPSHSFFPPFHRSDNITTTSPSSPPKFSHPVQSAKYLDVLSKSYLPREHHDLSELRQILSTGSPLKPETFDFVYKDIKQDLLLGSITGGEYPSLAISEILPDVLAWYTLTGTDICSLFAGHNASLPASP
jgi:acetoacetyl-CoA synthetase